MKKTWPTFSAIRINDGNDNDHPPPPPPSPVGSSAERKIGIFTGTESKTISSRKDLRKEGRMRAMNDDEIFHEMRSVNIGSNRNNNYSNFVGMPLPARPPEFRNVAPSYSVPTRRHNTASITSLLDLDDEEHWIAANNATSSAASNGGGTLNPFLDFNDHEQRQNEGPDAGFYHHSASLPDDFFRQHQLTSSFDGGGGGCPLLHVNPFSVEEDDYKSCNDDIDDGNSSVLPEFVGSGGGQGIFKVPLRAPVHLGRPPSLELRPHPLRETQAGSFFRTIACTPSQLWAGQEAGVRFWSFSDVFAGREPIGRVLLGDEESAPFRESCRTSPTLCFAVDSANNLVWSGHKDGKIRSWKMDQSKQDPTSDGFHSTGFRSSFDSSYVPTTTQFREGFSWQAHRGPVLSMIFTSQGDIWSGSENGVIKAWPWKLMDKSLSLTNEERSHVDLRSQVTVGGVCSLPSSDVKFLLSDHSRSRVWSGGSLSFALWNSRTKELLKVFSTDGQIDTRVDMLAGQESSIDDEMKIKFVSVSKKEKSQGPISFLQRSRNALMGAADAVRRVATKGAFGDDNRKTEAMTISMDGLIWSGCGNGSLVQWDGNGNRLQEFQYQSSSVQCLCSFGSRLWVGYVNGSVQVLDIEGNLIGEWIAHSSPVIDMAVGGGYVFTLANHGGIRGWNLTSPGRVDDILKLELTNIELLYSKLENIKILAGTWNVGQERASNDSLISWIGCSASEADIVVVGLQEVEMGAGFLAMAAAKETVGLEGSANGHWWLDTIGKTLDEGTTFEHVGSRQLAGLLISVWAKKNLRKHIGDVDAGAVPCGFGRAIGNKGSVGLKMRVYDKIFCFLNCHFAAHLEAVNRRNSDFDHVYRAMSFSRPSTTHYSTAGSSSAVQLLRAPNVTGPQSDDGNPELSEADMVIFLGDFNYRLQGISYDEARDFISQRCFDWLREKDQLREEMKAGRVFQGMREGIIRFPPTYKFERNQIGLAGYNSGEKKRIPAWCDRILYRDNRSISAEECSLSCPVTTNILQYDSCMDVTDSDHKPVRCLFNVNIARVDELIRRQEFGKILASEKIRFLLEDLSNIPETIVSTNNLILQNQDPTVLRITNRCDKGSAIFEIKCDGQASKGDGFLAEHRPKGAFGFPRWLEVTPGAGIIQPGQTVEVSLHHEEFQTTEEFIDGISHSCWYEDTKNEEVILLVNVTGSFSAGRRSHRIRVCHRFSSISSGNKMKTNNSTTTQSSILHRADFHHLSADIDDMGYLHDS